MSRSASLPRLETNSSKASFGRTGYEERELDSRATSTPPRPWAVLAAVIGTVGLLMWFPSGSFSGFAAPVGLFCVAAGWRCAPRRWLLWAGFLLNVVLLGMTIVLWLPP